MPSLPAAAQSIARGEHNQVAMSSSNSIPIAAVSVVVLVGFCSFATADRIGDCRDIADDAERLACYDAQESSVPEKTDTDAGDTASATEAQPRTEPPAKEPAAFSAVVVAVSRRALGQNVVELDNGDVWQEPFASSYFPVDVGDTIIIVKRRFTGYRLVTTSGKAFSVERKR